SRAMTYLRLVSAACALSFLAACASKSPDSESSSSGIADARAAGWQSETLFQVPSVWTVSYWRHDSVGRPVVLVRADGGFEMLVEQLPTWTGDGHFSQGGPFLRHFSSGPQGLVEVD